MANRDVNAAGVQSLDPFHAAMQRANTVALWEWNDARSNSRTQSESSFHWRWSEVEPLFDQAVKATSMSSAERRVVQLKNPHFPPDYIAVTTNINCGFQTLMPGESARSHRHNINALRFVVEGLGAITTVDGVQCAMEPGDLIVTPAMSWHEHTHHGSTRVVWMDALDSPLVRHLRCVNFEPGRPEGYPPSLPEGALSRPGFVPGCVEHGSTYPMFRYSSADTFAALEALPPEADGSRLLRYVNPMTGGAVMSLIDCYMLMLQGGSRTRAYRTTSNAACLVAEGEGESVVGETTTAWQKNDVFTLPAWQWITHIGRTKRSRLFQVTDREVLRRLELLEFEYETS